MWQRFGVLRVKHQKVGLNRRPMPILYCVEGGGGQVLTQHLITWHGNGQSTRHLLWVIRLTRCTARNCQNFHMTAVHQIFYTLLFCVWGRQLTARIESRQYTKEWGFYKNAINFKCMLLLFDQKLFKKHFFKQKPSTRYISKLFVRISCIKKKLLSQDNKSFPTAVFESHIRVRTQHRLELRNNKRKAKCCLQGYQQ